MKRYEEDNMGYIRHLSPDELKQLKKDRKKEKKQLKEAREWAAYEKEREDNYVGYEDAIKSTHAYQSILKKKKK